MVHLLHRLVNGATRSDVKVLIIASCWAGDWEEGKSYMHDGSFEGIKYQEWALAVAPSYCVTHVVRLGHVPELWKVAKDAIPDLNEGDCLRLAQKSLCQPLFFKHILMLLLEHGQVWLSSNGVKLTDLAIAKLEELTTFSALCRYRFSTLPEDLKRYLAICSAQGEIFLHRICRPIINSESAHKRLNFSKCIELSYKYSFLRPLDNVDGAMFDQMDYYLLAKEYLEYEGAQDHIKRCQKEILIKDIKCGNIRQATLPERIELDLLAISALNNAEDDDGNPYYVLANIDLAHAQCELGNPVGAHFILKSLEGDFESIEVLSSSIFPAEQAMWLLDFLIEIGDAECAGKVAPIIDRMGDPYMKAVQLGMRARLCMSSNSKKEAEQLLLESIVMLEKLEREESNVVITDSICVSKEYLADLWLSEGKVLEGLKLHAENAETRANILRVYGEDATRLRAYTVSLNRLAIITIELALKKGTLDPESQSGDMLEMALGQLITSYNYRVKIINEYGEIWERYRDLATTSIRIYQCCKLLNRIDEARSALDQAIEQFDVTVNCYSGLERNVSALEAAVKERESFEREHPKGQLNKERMEGSEPPSAQG